MHVGTSSSRLSVSRRPSVSQYQTHKTIHLAHPRSLILYRTTHASVHPQSTHGQYLITSCRYFWASPCIIRFTAESHAHATRKICRTVLDICLLSYSVTLHDNVTISQLKNFFYVRCYTNKTYTTSVTYRNTTIYLVSWVRTYFCRLTLSGVS